MPRQTRAQLESHLSEQVGFLIASAQLFDDGNVAEAKRLAATVRTLAHHNPPSSEALLSQLECLQTMKFLDSANQIREGNLISTFARLTNMRVQANDSVTQVSFGAKCAIPPLPKSTRWVNFSQWWDVVVLRDENGVELGRRRTILWVSNKDGGAHVDRRLPVAYESIKTGGTMGWRKVSGGAAFDLTKSDLESPRPLDNEPVMPTVRQIAHEVLMSIDRAFPGVCAAYPQVDWLG